VQPAYEGPPIVDMVHEIEKLFDHFTRYSYEFNKSMNFAGPQLEVERPVHVKAGDPRYGAHGQAAFSGRLMIHQWSLVIRGHDEVMEGFVMPSEQVLRYNADPDASNHPRFFRLELSSESGVPMWMVGKKPLPFDELSIFAKQLITSLVRIAKKGKATRAFQFVLADNSQSTPAPAPGNVPPPEPASPASTLPTRPSRYDDDSSLVGGPPGGGSVIAPATVPQSPMPPSPRQPPMPPSPMQSPMPPSPMQPPVPPSPLQSPAPPSPMQST